ncbi:MAG: transglycosylase domain-containing protein, partial [Candidatus Doudnabacteria bacterium]|nr:transglycosylase domain-containing protein [Candidatus Doudnabacteria bacterium]
MGILDTIIQTKQSETLRNFNPESIVNEVLGVLKERERQILMKRYGLKGSEIKTLAAIGSEHGLTRERVRQIEKDLIKMLKKTARSHNSLNLVRELILTTLNEHGKIMAEEALLKSMGIKSEADRNAIIFIMALIEDVESYLHENYKKCWMQLAFNQQFLHDFTREAQKLLEAANRPVEEKEFLESFAKTEFAKNSTFELGQKVILNLLDLAHKVEKNVFGHWGLSSWKQIIPKDVGDKAYLVLKQHGKPEHYSAITEMINKAKFDSRVSARWQRMLQVTAAVLIVLLCGTVGVGVGVANWLQKDLPSPTSLQTIAPPVKTIVYDIHWKMVHEFYKENRNIIPLRQIPKTMIDAILSIEDRRFYSHWGIDPIRLLGALANDIAAGRAEQG